MAFPEIVGNIGSRDVAEIPMEAEPIRPARIGPWAAIGLLIVVFAILEVVLPMAGLDSFVPKLTEHLLTADFFDAAKYPQATFRSTSVKALGEGRLEVTGTLDLHGVQKPVVLEVKLNKAAPHAMGKKETIGFDATATIRRSDFGINLYVPNVSDEVALRITTEASVPSGAK